MVSLRTLTKGIAVLLIVSCKLFAEGGPTYIGGTPFGKLQPYLATTYPYTDDPLVGEATPIKRVHVSELRTAVDAERQQAGLAVYAWADPQPLTVRAIHLTQLRAAVAEALAALKRPVPAWSEPIVPGGIIKAQHLQEIRDITRWEASGTIASDTTWRASSSPYVILGSVSVTNGATLTIEPGTVVKFSPNTSLIVLGTSRLIADGASQGIVFTSLKDDSVGGDTNRDGDSSKPAPGDWGVLGFGSGNQAAFGSLTHAKVSYGSQLRTLYSVPTLRDVTSTNMSGDGLYIESPPSAYTVERMVLTNNLRNLMLYNVPASTTIRDCIIRGATQIAVNAVQNSAARLENNAIDNNGGGAAVVADSTSPLVLRYNSITNNRTSEGYARGVRVACCATVDARENWWGSTTGPEVEGQANSGGGGQVGTNVLYDPWLGKFLGDGFKRGDHPWTLKAGVGVDVATGNFFLVENDLSISTVGFPLEIVRTYNSKNAGGVRTDFGDGWMWNYGTLIRNADPPYGVVWLREDGTETYLKRNPDDTFSSEEGIYEKLAWHSASATYRMTRKDQSVFIFSSDGRLSAQVDANGNRTTITRDASGRVVQVTEPSNRSLMFEYAADGYIYRVTDPLGRTLVYQRNPNGAIANVVMRDQLSTLFGTTNYYYGPGGRWEMTGFADSDGNTLEQSFDAATQRVTQQRFNNNAPVRFAYGPTTAFGFKVPEGSTAVEDMHARVHEFRYTPSNKVTDHFRQQVIEGGGWEWIHDDEWSYTSYLVSRYINLNGSTESTYDWNTGNLTKLVEPGGRTTTYTYDAFNNRTSTTDNLGRVTSYAYDTNQRLIRATDALGRTTQHEYEATGLLAHTIDPLGRVTSFHYDAFGYPLQKVNALNQVTRFTYDVIGRKLVERNPLGQQVSTNYDGRGNPLDITDPLGNQTAFTYDAKGRKTQVRDGEGRVTRYEYIDTKNALVRTIDALGGMVELTRDDFGGNITAVKDARGNVTTFAYDDLNRKVLETDPLGRSWRYAYLRLDLLANVTDARGDRTVYLYDSSNRLAAISYPDGTQTSNTYDAVGNRTKLTDWTGETTWTHDALNRVVECKKNGLSTGYSYDAAGYLASLTYPGNKTVTYAYDELNRLKTVTDWDGRVTSYTNYDAAGRLKIFTYPNGVSAIHDYDAAGRLSYLLYSKQNTILRAFTYEYDRVGNRKIRRSLIDGNIEESYSYDALYRLTDAYYADTAKYVVYSHDAAGNRTQQQEATGNGPWSTTFTGTYDAADQLQSGGGWTRTYDENGSQLIDGPRSLSWSPQHLLSQVAMFDTTTFTYDGDGRRVRQGKSGIVTDYVPDTTRKISEVLMETSTASTTYYIYGHDLLYSIESGAPHYLHADGIGSTLVGTNGLGQEDTRHTYDVFGAIRSMSGSHVTRRRFTGEENDDTGLIFLRARYYNPGVGRFVSRDPFPMDAMDTQSVNRYVYVKNNPTNYVDPSGEVALWDDLAFAAAGALGGVLGLGIHDAWTRQFSGWSSYAGSAVGGAVTGVTLPYLTVSLNIAGPAAAGALGAAVSEGVRQSIDNAAYDIPFDKTALGRETLVGAAFGYLPGGAKIKAAPHSTLQVGKALLTRLETAPTTRISALSGLKLFYGKTVVDFQRNGFNGTLRAFGRWLQGGR